jgi:hypothetical protein
MFKLNGFKNMGFTLMGFVNDAGAVIESVLKDFYYNASSLVLASASVFLGEYFRADTSYTMTKIKVTLERQGGASTMAFNVGTCNAIGATRTILETQSIDVSALPLNTPTVVEITLETPIEVTAGSSYFFWVNGTSIAGKYQESTIADQGMLYNNNTYTSYNILHEIWGY